MLTSINIYVSYIGDAQQKQTKAFGKKGVQTPDCNGS